MSAPTRRIVVVLGMHRSGTSTLARALQVLGVDLGDNLLPPAAGDNERGYWEDADVHALDMEMLHALGHDWHTLAPVTHKALEGPVAQSYRARAAELLAAKLAPTGCFGLKDPRISRLIPFWKRIFEDVGAEPSYLIVSRNPLSVARSLARRDGFDPVKSHYLWIEHMATSLVETAGARRVVVDYDAFMDDPENQLRRVARELELPFAADSAAFREFRDGFVTESLRHTRFSLVDLRADPAVPPAAAALFEALQGMASGRVDPDGGLVRPLLEYLARLEDDLAPGLAYMRTHEERAQNLAAALAESDRAQRELDRALNEEKEHSRVREAEAVHLRTTLATHEHELAEARAAALARAEESIRLSARLDEAAVARAAGEAEAERLRAEIEHRRTTTWSIPRPGRILRALRGRRGG
jgi:hypothetical protein